MPLDAPDRRFLAMPGYLGGRFHIAGMKWYGSNINNPQIGLPRSVLMVMLNNVETGEPVALMSTNHRKTRPQGKRRSLFGRRCPSAGGMVVWDLGWSCELLENARKMGLGVSLNLWTDPYLA